MKRKLNDYWLDGDTIEVEALHKEIRNFLGSKATFSLSEHEGRFDFNIRATRPLTDEMLNSLEEQSERIRIERSQGRRYLGFDLNQSSILERQADQDRILEKAAQNETPKLEDLKKFSSNFKLSTPLPQDLLPIFTKDEAKRKVLAGQAEYNAKTSPSAHAVNLEHKKPTPMNTRPTYQPAGGSLAVSSNSSQSQQQSRFQISRKPLQHRANQAQFLPRINQQQLNPQERSYDPRTTTYYPYHPFPSQDPQYLSRRPVSAGYPSMVTSNAPLQRQHIQSAHVESLEADYNHDPPLISDVTPTRSIRSVRRASLYTNSTFPSRSSRTLSIWSSLGNMITESNDLETLLKSEFSLLGAKSPGKPAPDSSSLLGMQDVHAFSLVKDLGARILELDSSIIGPQNFIPRVVTLLKAFSMRLGYDGDTDQHRHAMKFVYKYSDQIAQGLNQMIFPKETSMKSRDLQPNMSPHEKIEVLWRDTEHQSETDSMKLFGGERRELESQGNFNAPASIDTTSQVQELPEVVLDEDGDYHNLPAFEGAFTRLIKESAAYSWLVESILNEFRLSQNSPTHAHVVIRQQILDLRSDHRILDKHQPPPSLKLTIAFGWDLQDFVHQQYQDLKRRVHDMKDFSATDWIFEEAQILSLDTIERTITLTGNGSDVQALTCGEYLQLVWPRTGMSVLQILKAAARNVGVMQRSCLPNNTKLNAKNQNGKFWAGISGEAHAAAETVEILAWIVSALQASIFGQQISSIEPKLTIQGSAPRKRFAKDPQGLIQHNIQLNFERSKFPRQAAGSCWHDMFNNPVVVLGYPIRQRHASQIGLEVTTDIITMVMQTRRWNVYNSKLYIKAFSAMLIPTKRLEQSLLWHYIYEPDGKYLWFEQDGILHEESVTPYDLDTQRHFIGWCSKVISHVGSKNARFEDIQESELDPPKSSFALKGFSISAGHFGAIGISATIGHKDPAIRVPLAGFGFGQKLTWVAEQFVLLWDTEYHRGWLVDGASALLHLVRTTLKNLWNSKLRDLIIIKENDIIEPNTTDESREDFVRYPDAALRFFTLQKLRNMKLLVEEHSTEKFREGIGGNAYAEPVTKTTYVLLQHVVEHLLDAIAGALFAPSYLKERDGQHIKTYNGEHLDGWNFKALATRLLDFQPVTQTFDCWALPWVEFIRSINAVTLFGTGFGELIEPFPDHSICTHWQKLPPGKNYVASCCTTLAGIMDRHKGRPLTTPIQLTPKFIWYNNQVAHHPSNVACSGQRCIAPQDLVQVIWDKTTKWPWHQPIPAHCSRLQEEGAVIFGYPDDRFKKYLRHWWKNLRGIQLGAGESLAQERPAVNTPRAGLEGSGTSQRSSPSVQSLQTTMTGATRTLTDITSLGSLTEEPEVVVPRQQPEQTDNTVGRRVIRPKKGRQNLSLFWK